MNSVNCLYSFLLPLYLSIFGHFFHNFFLFLWTYNIPSMWFMAACTAVIQTISKFAITCYKLSFAGVISWATRSTVWINLSTNPLSKSRKEWMWHVWHFFSSDKWLIGFICRLDEVSSIAQFVLSLPSLKTSLNRSTIWAEKKRIH